MTGIQGCPDGMLGGKKTEQVYYNQALNTFFNYGTRGLAFLKHNWFIEIKRLLILDNIEKKSKIN